MKPIIYQLVVRYFGNLNLTNQKYGDIKSNGCGKFSNISATALKSLRNLGVTHIWLTGCLRQATLTSHETENIQADDPDIVKGTAGSFYAIRDYFDVCPDYAVSPSKRMTEFEDLISRIHAVNLKVLIDFVPNHVARSYHSVVRPDLDFGLYDNQSHFYSTTNDFFYTGAPSEELRLSRPTTWMPPDQNFDGRFEVENGTTGHRPKVTGSGNISTNPGPDDWYETIKLNYGFDFTTGKGNYAPRPRTWSIMDNVIQFWQDKGVDGFRCDMAHLVPEEFWHFLIEKALARNKNVYFLAEAYFNSYNIRTINSKNRSLAVKSLAPIGNMSQLINSGFHAIYNDQSLDALKRIYINSDGHVAYDKQLSFPPIAREHLLSYLENHDELRIPAPINTSQPENSGFGSIDASYQLAPLQFLSSAGPILVFNGQEIGEHGSKGGEGWSVRVGHSTFYDYWAMPDFSRWVNDYLFDESLLTENQKGLRKFYSSLLALCQDAAIVSKGFWGLNYYNMPECSSNRSSYLFSFARYIPNSGRVLVVIANLRPGSETQGSIALPPELIADSGLDYSVQINLIFGRDGEMDIPLITLTIQDLQDAGFEVLLPNQTTQVYCLETTKS